ncbi:hypothetical protein H5968_20990 [Sphaerospermopsis sp. LEGE 00249]|nr:hypothetical protein [Sphaerospermopsis sp. LEGE 00249]MBC5797558.1 hypothetical protein [Sphaerospermopsis sp. LEGE 00249]
MTFDLIFLPSPQSPIPSDALSLSKCPQSPITILKSKIAKILWLSK